MKAQVVTSADRLPADRWDALTGGAVYGGHRWLTYQETDAASDATYVVVGDRGTWLGAAPVYLVRDERNASYRPPLSGPAETGAHVLVGNRRGYSNSLLVVDDHRRDRVLAVLLDDVHEASAGHGVDRAWWLHLDDRSAADLVPHALHGVPLLLAGDCSIDLPGDDFDDYLAGVTASVRKRVRRDRVLFDRAGYRTDDLPLSACWPEVARLVHALQLRHGHAGELEDTEHLLQLQADAMGDDARVDACFSGARMAGANVRFGSAREVVSRACGFDYDLLQDASEYFELAYYRAIEAACRAGATRLGLGIGTYETKIRRGALVDLRWAVATGAGGTRLDDDDIRRRNDRTWDRLVAEGLREDHLRAERFAGWFTQT